MTTNGHLALSECALPPATELELSFRGWCVVRVEKGLGYFLAPKTPRELAEHDVLVLPEGVRGNFRASRLTALTLQYFTVTPEQLSGLPNLAERHYLDQSSQQTTPRYFSAHEPVAQRFRVIASQAPPVPGLRSRCQFLALFAELLADELTQVRPEDLANASARARFQRLIHQLPEGELHQRSVPELAQLCQCSDRHFSRMFREHFGVSIREWQMDYRLERARQLLRDSEVRVVQVARESGYRNLGLFHSLFKRRFGVTPSQWRRELSQGKANGHATAR